MILENDLNRRLRRLAAFAPSNAARRAASPILPPVMASPPTVTTQVGVTSTITSSVQWTLFQDAALAGWSLSPKFTFMGWPRTPAASNRNYVTTNTRFFGGEAGIMRTAFYTDATTIEFYTAGGAGCTYNLRVNGSPVFATAQTGPASTGLIIVQLGNAGTFKHVELICPGSAFFYAVNIGPVDSIHPSSWPVGDQWFVIGDSYTEGANGTNGLDTWAPKLMDLMGCRDSIIDGIGGTGVAAGSTGVASSLTKSSYRARLEFVATLGITPVAVVLQGSTNDSSTGGTDYHPNLPSEYQACVKTIRRNWPDALLVGTDVMKPTQNITVADLAINGWLNANAPGLVDVYVTSRNFRDPWFKGTGKVGALTGSGNSDRFMSSDSVHPTEPGHSYIAYRVAAEINRQALEAEAQLSILA